MAGHHPGAPLRRRVVQALALCAAMLAGPASAQAAEYPQKPIRMLVGFAAGGTTDLLARQMAQELSAALGQPVTVENRPGAGGNIAAEQAAQARPDGYTLIMGAINHAINATLYPRLNYDQLRDLAPVSMVAITPNALIVPADSPFKSVADVIEYGRANPGKLTYASSGIGTSVHLSGAMFASAADLDMIHVPYQGVAPAEMDVVGGRVAMMFDSIYTALPLIKSDKVRVLAVTSAQRSSSLPEVPTIAESGLPGFDVSPWYCVFVPSGTPPEVIERLNAVIVAAMDKPAVKEKLASLGTEPFAGTPAEADAYVRAEIDKWAEIIRATGATAQ